MQSFDMIGLTLERKLTFVFPRGCTLMWYLYMNNLEYILSLYVLYMMCFVHLYNNKITTSQDFFRFQIYLEKKKHRSQTHVVEHTAIDT